MQDPSHTTATARITGPIAVTAPAAPRTATFRRSYPTQELDSRRLTPRDLPSRGAIRGAKCSQVG